MSNCCICGRKIGGWGADKLTLEPGKDCCHMCAPIIRSLDETDDENTFLIQCEKLYKDYSDFWAMHKDRRKIETITKKGRDHMPMPQERTYTSEDYWNLPEGQRAELIDGKLYAMAPPNRIHQKILGTLHSVIFNHISQQKGSCEVYPAPFAVNLNANDKI